MKLLQYGSMQFISLPVYFLFSILVSSAQANPGESNACEGLLLRSATAQEEHLPLRQTELKVSDSKKKAEAIRALKNARLELESYGVSQSGEIRKFQIRQELHFAESQNVASVDVFGFPYVVSGERFIDLRLKKGFDQKNVKPSPILQRVKLSRFYAAIGDEYFRYSVNPGSLALYRIADSDHLRVCAVQSIGDHEISVVVRGGTLNVPKEIFFADNAFLNAEEKRVLRKFNEAGGEGDVVVLSSGEGRNAKYGGVYIEIKKLPGKESAVLSRLVYDGLTYDLIDSLRQSGTTVLLTDGSKGFSALHAGGSHPLSKAVGRISRPTITITDTTESSVVVHEVRHLDDSRSGVLKELTDWLDVQAERFKIQERDIVDLYYLIAEQRAYAGQFEYLDGLAEKPDANPMTIRGIFDDQTVDVHRYVTSVKAKHLAWVSLYLERARKVLASSKLPAQIKNEYADLARKLFYPSRELSWDALKVVGRE